MFAPITRPIFAFAVSGILIAGLAVPPPLAAQGKEPDKAQGSPSSGSSAPVRTGNGGKPPEGSVFRPKETIAPGKPVSFPSDI